MTYSVWNDLIAKYFFNAEHGGKDVLLYLTKEDLIKQGRQHLNGLSDELIWADFMRVIIFGDQPENERKRNSPISKPCELYTQWNRLDTPPFIAYLILYIIPLTEKHDGDFRADNYYGKVTEFFRKNRIIDLTEKIWSGNFSMVSNLWNELEEWSVITKNCDLGIFELKKFGNPNWIHVGKPSSQCLLAPSTINNLPELFFEAGLIPDSAYSKEEFRQVLLKYGTKILSLKSNEIELIRRSESNELGQTILDIVDREYKKWTGETHIDIVSIAPQNTKRNYTVAPFFLQFKINDNDGLISFSYRTYSSNDYPEDLKFGQFDHLYETNGWSRTLTLDFKRSFELKDDFNKWIARFPDRDVRLFVNAGTYQLSSGYWIETDSLSKTDPMYLLCKKENAKSILEWGNTFRSGNFKLEDLEGLPENYFLFKILSPAKSHPDIPLLTLYTEKRIELTGGLKVNFRTFINDFLPEVEIANSDGNERVFLQYRGDENRLPLRKKLTSGNRWELPHDVSLDVDFYIKVEKENLAGNEIAFSLTSSYRAATKVDGSSLPKRDSFGRVLVANSNQYSLGSNIINPKASSKRYFCPWESEFTPNEGGPQIQISRKSFENHCGNMLCSFLTLKNTLTTEEFFRAFEFYLSKEFSGRQSPNFNLTRTKKSSLNFYDYTGVLDYELETKKIILNPPQLIFIPVKQGRKVLIVGARDLELIEAIIDKAPMHNLRVQITKQFSANERLLLPDVVTIEASGKSRQAYGEKNIIEFAKDVNLRFTNNYFPQVALQEYSSNIVEYEKSLVLTDENDYDWARRIFNPEDLTFARNESAIFDKSFSLIEYKLNEYRYHYKLWREGKCYHVDRNWGKYLVLRKFKKNVIFYDDERDHAAIPVETPLPNLLSKSIMLLSGTAPDLREYGGKKFRVYENIGGILSKNLFLNLGQRPLNKELP